MKEIITADDSITFYNEKYDEAYHSISGAKEEALKKFAEPCRIGSLQTAVILDICFGIGYNSAAALDLFKGTAIEMVGIENDPKIINRILDIDAPFLSYGLIQLLADQKEVLIDIKNYVHLKLLIEDARKAIKSLPSDYFTTIFLDPFSPKKCPELWTEDFFKEIYRVSKPGAILATYSCARVVRDNLRTAGFKVQDGPRVGRRAPGTIALKE